MKVWKIILILIGLIGISLCNVQLCDTYTDSTNTTCQTCSKYSNLNNGYCQCYSNFYMNTALNDSYPFCDRCHTSCQNCFGPLSTNCLSCTYFFTFNTLDYTCTPPNNNTVQTLAYAYQFYGFTKLSTWTITGNPSPNTYNCRTRTLLGGLSIVTGSSSSISTTISNLAYHFQLRVKVAFYYFNPDGNAVSARVSVDSDQHSYPMVSSAPNSNVFQCSNGGVGFSHINIDDNFTHNASTATISFSISASYSFAIRQFYLITKLCSQVNCSTCTGYNANQCVGCADTRRIVYSSITNGTCLCTGNYYQQPYSGNCVTPCPSVPIKYYGDNSTRFCVANCPNNTYAYDDLYRCWIDCPTVSVVTSQLLFKDKTNWKCVTNCPATEPYAYETDRICYSTCPNNTYATDSYLKRCLATCPSNATYQLYAYNGSCIPRCPNGTWANILTIKCQTTCPNASYPFKDNSTGINRCVSSCPSPEWFSENTNFYCVRTCPSPTFGQVNQTCVTKCSSTTWGLLTGNRMCINNCQAGTWGQSVDRTCVLATTDCPNGTYADNLTRQCVVATSCSFGTYADNNTRSCVFVCPNNSFAHSTSKYCQQDCAPQFRDTGINQCVSVCVTQNTYADVSSDYNCTTACNVNGSTPWADSSTKTCVNDCNNTVSTFVADNTTWKCIYYCPAGYYVDNTTTAPKCVQNCPNTYFADNSTGTGICVKRCSENPPKFGDSANGMNKCVDVCTVGTYGDETGYRLCVTNCTSPYFAQNNSARLCVKRCGYSISSTLTYGNYVNRFCEQTPQNCPTNYFGDNSTNLCVNPCPISQGTYGDPISKLCTLSCPSNSNSSGPSTYFADPTIRQCVLTCNSSSNLFGNNDTRTCVSQCQDINSYAQVQTTNRLCVSRCLASPSYFYANNFTKVCGSSFSCQTNYFGQNSSQLCVEYCPTPSFAYINTTVKLCMEICPSPQYGDNTTGKRLCVGLCPAVPPRFSSDTDNRTCVATCPNTTYGQYLTRTCTNLCPSPLYSYQPTRLCLDNCPSTYFADNTTSLRKCWSNSSACTFGFGDPYLNKCVYICSGPPTYPVDLFGTGKDCVSFCPNGTYADSYTGTRLCVSLCPPGNVSTSPPNLYGDPTTRQCVDKCITPNTWADWQTRLCQPICSANSTPTYSENYYMTCVISLNCPTIRGITFGDNNTRSCVTNCSLGKFGDPTSRNCVTQCPNTTSTVYFGDISTGQYLCVIICPIVPRLFGENTTNLCVSQCPNLTYGDQTGNRTCVPKCPIISSVNYYAQNTSRICVLVCENATWGYNTTQQCVLNPFHCGTQWAQNQTHMCVTTCPLSLNAFGDPTTRLCVKICPNGSYSDASTRQCVTGCPANYGILGTFANNNTNNCQQFCTQPNGYADPQTTNRYCVSSCTQSPNTSFADPSTKRCVPRCPTAPDLYGQTQTFTCISKCVSPYFANTITRLCQMSCPTSYFKLRTQNLCVSVCPTNPALFGDSATGFCQSTCTNGTYIYTTQQKCVSSCQTYSLLEFNWTCVKYCPTGFYANTTGNCVSGCPNSTYGQNTTTTCQATCITGYAYNGLCLAVCPDGKWGQNKTCKDNCTSPLTASNATNLCVSNCIAGQYIQSLVCVTNCSSGYADPLTGTCFPSCTSPNYGDPSTKKCVAICPANSYNDSSGYCKTNCSPLRADNITWSCTNKCSNGSWGYNYECISQCPTNYYAYEVDRDCYNTTYPPVSSGLFASNVSQLWVPVCPLNPLLFGDRTLKACVSQCNGTLEFADPQSRQCETTCTNSSYYRDTSTNSCVLSCPTNSFANYLSFNCEPHCTLGLYDYAPSHICVDSCPKPYYGHVNYTCLLQCPDTYFSYNDICRLDCPPPYFADPVTQSCVTNCVNSYASTVHNQCLPNCSIYNEIADNSTNRCVSVCPSSPDLYKQGNMCVLNCTSGFADPTVTPNQSTSRICTSLCTQGLFAQPLSKRCLSYCLPGYFAQPSNNYCLQSCLTGFADNSTGTCVSNCTDPTFADSLLGKCVKVCSGTQFGQNGTCVPVCTDPNYGNPLTRLCQLNCPQFEYLFAENNSRLCVNNCSVANNSYADRNVRACVRNCTLPNQYALDGYAICTSLCPNGLFMQNSTQQCLAQCLTGFAEPTSRYCVARCFGNPQTFGYNKTCLYTCPNTNTTNLFADDSTNLCVPTCPSTPIYFSDPLSRNCVPFCPQGYYSQTNTRTCAPSCVVGYADNSTRSCASQCPMTTEQTFALNHLCVRVCPNNMFADTATKSCVNFNGCTNNTYSDNITKYCVERCPMEPLSFGLNTSTTCLPQCPTLPDLFGDFVTQTCVSTCYSVNGTVRFADPVSRICVFQCPINSSMYGDLLTGRCTDVCSSNQIRDNSTQMCVPVCPSNPDYYANLDLANYMCVRKCPDGRYASDQSNRVCISNCSLYLTYADNVTNRCQATCRYPYFADNSSYLCVLYCPINPDYYADTYLGKCVFNCSSGLNWITYADPLSRKCVTRCPNNTFAHNSTGRCIDRCPNNQYAESSISVCVANCTVRPKFYRQTGNNQCVSKCPSLPVKSYSYQVNNSCVYTVGINSGCPNLYYADTVTNSCVLVCPLGYFAQDSTKKCVPGCSGSEYADPVDRKCKSSCTTDPEYFIYQNNTCIQHCPNSFYSDHISGACLSNCSTSTLNYAYNVTNQCLSGCLQPYYAHLPWNKCILYCPSPYFAQDSTRSCELTCNSPFFADNSTNRCVILCPDTPNLYGSNNVCVFNCPNGTYRDYSTRMCVGTCPIKPLLFADNSTNTCVPSCPSTPNYFADNTTSKCVFNCTNGTFASVTTRQCLPVCPQNQQKYADPITLVCQPYCLSPYYASNLTRECLTQCPNLPIKTYALDVGRICVFQCIPPYFGQNSSGACVFNCSNGTYADITTRLCVTTCPSGWFSLDLDNTCVPSCPFNLSLYADSTTRKCVSICPSTQRLFADNTSSTCVTQCPPTFFGDTTNPTNWICLPNCPNAINAFMLRSSNLCVQECPSPFFGLTSSSLCVIDCGAGWFGQLVTRRCTLCPSTCPTCQSLTNCSTCSAGLYLEYGLCVTNCTINSVVANYRNSVSMRCVSAAACPSGSYGNNVTGNCSNTCPSYMFRNNATKTCDNCPQFCTSCIDLSRCLSCTSLALFSQSDLYCFAKCNSTYPYSYNGDCYLTCPNGTYGSYTQVNCQTCNEICSTCSMNALNCTDCSGSFLFNNTCLTQCPTNYYALNKQCLLCTSSVASCSRPLTFNVSTTVENYKSVLILQFNQPTTSKSPPSNFIKVKLKFSRLLQTDYSSIINSGIQFDAVVLADGTIKLILQHGLTLVNPVFEVVIVDPSQISTKDGSVSLQKLGSTIQIPKGQTDVYPPGTTTNAPLVVAATVLDAFMLILLLATFIIGPLPIFHVLQAFQMVSFLAYSSMLPPSLFYFLRQLRFSRLLFLPSVFSSLYSAPQGYSASIPSRSAEIDGCLSFYKYGGGLLTLILFYLFMGAIVYILSSRVNSNRPLKNLFLQIYEGRIKIGLVNDLIWLVGLNVLVVAMLQLRRKDDGGEIAVATLSLLFMAAVMVAVIAYGIYQNKNAPQSIQKTYSALFNGTKQHSFPIAYIYYIRKILYAILLTATIFSPKAQAASLIALFSMMLLVIVVMRPYTDMLVNVMHGLNEFGQIFLWFSVIWYMKLVDIGEPVGTKILWGQVVSIIVIIYLSIAIVWGVFRTYNYIQYLKEILLESQFYKLYMDEQFEESVEKELTELKNDDAIGEVESINVTNVGQDDDQVIKLRIKRKVRKNKPQQQKQFQKPIKKQPHIKKQQYIKIQPENQLIYTLPQQQQYQKMNFHQHSDSPSEIKSDRKSDEGDWIEVKQSENFTKKQKSQVEEVKQNIFDVESEQQELQIHGLSQIHHIQPQIMEVKHNTEISVQENNPPFYNDLISNSQHPVSERKSQIPEQQLQKSQQQFSNKQHENPNIGQPQYQHTQNQQEQSYKQYDVLQSQQQSHKQSQLPQEQGQQPQKINKWGELEDLVESQKNEQKDQDQQKKKKLHMMLFDDFQ